MNKVLFIIPGKPQGKGRPRMTRSGHVYTPQGTIEYEQLVRICYYEQCGNKKLDGCIRAIIHAVFPIPASASKKKQAELDGAFYPKKVDADNLAKVCLDALNGFAYDDDAQVVSLEVGKTYGREPRVEVILQEVKQ